MARMAGLRLRDSWSRWRREPLTSESRSHVSVWEKPPSRRRGYGAGSTASTRIRTMPCGKCAFVSPYFRHTGAWILIA